MFYFSTLTLCRVSWNFNHLVKAKTRKLLNSVNILEGFNPVEIISPPEL
jgi:hypothetical protein